MLDFNKSEIHFSTCLLLQQFIFCWSLICFWWINMKELINNKINNISKTKYQIICSQALWVNAIREIVQALKFLSIFYQHFSKILVWAYTVTCVIWKKFKSLIMGSRNRWSKLFFSEYYSLYICLTNTVSYCLCSILT